MAKKLSRVRPEQLAADPAVRALEGEALRAPTALEQEAAELLLGNLNKTWGRALPRLTRNLFAQENPGTVLERLFGLFAAKVTKPEQQAALAAAHNAFQKGDRALMHEMLKGLVQKGSGAQRAAMSELVESDPVLKTAVQRGNRRGAQPGNKNARRRTTTAPVVSAPVEGPAPQTLIDEPPVAPEPVTPGAHLPFKKPRISKPAVVEEAPPVATPTTPGAHLPFMQGGKSGLLAPATAGEVPPTLEMPTPTAPAPAPGTVMPKNLQKMKITPADLVAAGKKGGGSAKRNVLGLLGALLGMGDPKGPKAAAALKAVGKPGAALSQKALGKLMGAGTGTRFLAGAGAYALIPLLINMAVGKTYESVEDATGSDWSGASKLDSRLRELQFQDADTMMASMLAQRYRAKQGQMALQGEPGLLSTLRMQQAVGAGQVPGDQPVGADALSAMGL